MLAETALISFPAQVCYVQAADYISADVNELFSILAEVCVWRPWLHRLHGYLLWGCSCVDARMVCPRGPVWLIIVMNGEIMNQSRHFSRFNCRAHWKYKDSNWGKIRRERYLKLLQKLERLHGVTFETNLGSLETGYVPLPRFLRNVCIHTIHCGFKLKLTI